MCLFMTIPPPLDISKEQSSISLILKRLILLRLMKISFSSNDVESNVESITPNSDPLAHKSLVVAVPLLILSLVLIPDYKAFYIDNDHFKEKSSGSTTTHVDFSKYDSFIFDLSINSYHPSNRSDFHEELRRFGEKKLAQNNRNQSMIVFLRMKPSWAIFHNGCVDCPDCEDSQFCHSSRVSHPQLHLGIRYPNLID
ncbi:hypothetical protein Tco_0065528 [Tanacetum coccineum]|uniref:Uncharacterized protein n=1 Tax=Tanacetum coccineum TaxID=301880 RepID=A0ABQ5DY58_9ASTR